MDRVIFNEMLEWLIAGRNQWQFLWITGGNSKESYKPARFWDCSCACCEYDERVRDRISSYEASLGTKACHFCLLRGYAWSWFCNMDPDSPYRKWSQADSIPERSKYAQEMVKAFNRAIEDVIKNL